MVQIEKVVAIPARLEDDFFAVRELVLRGKAATNEELEAYPFLAEYPCPSGFRRMSFWCEWNLVTKEFTASIIDREHPLQAVKE